MAARDTNLPGATMLRILTLLAVSVLAAGGAPAVAQSQQLALGLGSEQSASDRSAPIRDAAQAEDRSEFRSIDQQVQALKKEVLDLNRELFVLEEELLFPANTQLAVFVSMDVGEFFALDSVTLNIDDKEVASYLYTQREAQALLKGGVHRLYIGNLKAGEHELVALFSGQGPHARDYRRGATLRFEKGVGAKYLELKISDRAVKAQPEFIVKEWD
ncbi:MAG TPA: hypothetical protein VK025_14535 [Steroidobacter sp.]|jgi:hypothetical protein|nr:hypothetical protein [Steroidobacteraceae bacterium]HLS82614.1 hypothetical protein [Steroidobacter sp.]